MTTEETTITNSRNQKLYYQHFPKDLSEIEEIKGIFIFIHGFGEHCQRYNHVMEYLLQNKIISYAYDQHGHGQSEGESGHCRSFNDYVDDSITFIQYIQNEFLKYEKEKGKKLKYFLSGVSFGGLVALYTIIHKEIKGLPIHLNGIILVSPCLGIDMTKMLNFQNKVGSFMDKVVPKMSIVAAIDEKYLTRDESVLQDIRSDPLIRHKRCRVHSSIQIKSAYETISGFLHHITIPTLFMHSQDDKVTSYKESYRVYESLTETKDKEFKTWNGLYHDLLHEPEKDQIIEYIASWINTRLSDVPVKKSRLSVS